MNSAAVMRREDEILLACASACLIPQQMERIRALAGGPVDWASLRAAAQRHRVVPLVYRGLVGACPELVPEPIMGGLREEFHENARRNLFLTAELLRLVDPLKAEGVPVVPYKGPTLAALAYGDLALRDFSDNDFMIRREDLPRLKAVLLAQGYRPEISLTPAQEAAYLRSRHSLVFIDHGWSIVEFHWAFQPRYFAFSLDPQTLLDRLEPVTLAGRTVWTFSREDLVLILALHGAKHVWSRLEWICDLALLAHGDSGIDWARVLDRSRRLGARRMLLLGLYLAREFLSADLPPEVGWELAADPAVPGLGAEVRRRLFRGERAPGIMESSFFFVKTRERLTDKVRYCVRLATTPYLHDWAAVPLPDAASPLYYVIRPFRMIGHYAAAALRRQ